MNRIVLILLLSAFRLVSAGVSIGNEAALPRPTNAFYSVAINVRPIGTVTNNPPIFMWPYHTNLARQGGDGTTGDQDTGSKTNSFQLQVATNSAFTGTLLVDVVTELNWYNSLAPLLTNVTRTFWWRVKYIVEETPYWTNGVYVFNFPTAANVVTNWDRSMLADSTYLTTNGVHPFFCFRAGEQAAIYQWIQTNNATDYLRFTNAAVAGTNDASFKNTAQWETNTGSRDPSYASPGFTYPTRFNQLGSALLLWAISSDSKWTNANITGWHITNAAHLANWYLHPSNNWAMVDYGQPEGSPETVRLLCAYYDWMYNVMGSDTGTFAGQTRTNLLLALNRTCKFWTYNGWKTGITFPVGSLLLPMAQNAGTIQVTNSVATAPDWTFPIPYYPNTNVSFASVTNECLGWPGIPKIGYSHGSVDMQIAMIASFVGQADDDGCARAFQWYGQYLVAKTSPYAGYAAHHIGVYGYVDANIYSRSLLSGMLLFDQMYPQVNIWRNDFCQRFPDWWTRMLPYRMRKYHGPYGDGMPNGYFGFSFGVENRGTDLAMLARSGLARQAYDLNAEYRVTFDDTTSKWEQLALRWHYRVLPALQTNTTSALYPEDGYVVASTFSPSEFNCYTNGVGFSLRASPRLPRQGHNVFGSGSPDLWAYGTQITDFGGDGGLEWPGYGILSVGNGGLFVNGQGEGDVGLDLYGLSQTEPLHSSITAYTNSGTNFLYTCADLTPLFVNLRHPQSNIVVSVKRHMLFVRSRYWVFFDQWETRSNAVFAARWMVPWVYRYRASSTPATRELGFAGDIYGSNSLALSSNGFTYVSGNVADASYASPPFITNHIVFANNTNQFAVFVATGTNAIATSATSVIGTANTNSTLNPMISAGRIYATLVNDRAAGLWFTNRVSATNFSLCWAIVPRENGKSAPTIRRLDDTTLAVTYDGVTETNTFGTNYSGEFTYRVEVDVAANIGGGSSDPSRRTRSTRLNAGTVIH